MPTVTVTNPAAGEATSPAELRKQILDPNVSKNEREHWAARHIEKLESKLSATCILRRRERRWFGFQTIDTVVCGYEQAPLYLKQGYEFDWAATERERW